jgi:hypothetical protein
VYHPSKERNRITLNAIRTETATAAEASASSDVTEGISSASIAAIITALLLNKVSAKSDMLRSKKARKVSQ